MTVIGTLVGYKEGRILIYKRFMINCENLANSQISIKYGSNNINILQNKKRKKQRTKK